MWRGRDATAPRMLPFFPRNAGSLGNSLFSIIPTLCRAEDVSDLQKEARISWAAYRCAAFYATYGKDKTVKAKLIQIGFEHGTRWFSAARDGAHFNHDDTTPEQIVRVALEYRSTDYSLGRIEEIAKDSVFKQLDVYLGGIEKSTYETWSAAAKMFYTHGNCDLL